MLSSEVVRNEHGADVCHRVVKAAVENLPGDPSKGFHYVDAYCNKPVVFSVAERRKVCPDCDKQPPVGNVNPRVTNAAGTKLTPKEMEECGLNPDGTRIDGKEVQQKIIAKAVEALPVAAVEAKVAEVKKDEVVLNIPLKELEGNVDVAALLIKKVIEGFGFLPTPNYADAKRIMKLEEKLDALLRQ